MREILFRGKRLDNGEWVEGCLIRISFTKRSYIMYLVDDVGSWKDRPRIMYAEVDPATVGQFTGLCDGNGTKIFEGDLLRCFGSIPYDRRGGGFQDGEMTWSQHGWEILIHKDGKRHAPRMMDWRPSMLRVTGTIHDAKEG